MNNIELVLLRHENDSLMNIFVMRIIGEEDRIKQQVLYIESDPIGEPKIFPICRINMNFDPSWNDFYQKHGRVVDYRGSREEAIALVEKMIRDSAAQYIRNNSETSNNIALIDNLSFPSGGAINPNHRFWYFPAWAYQI